MTISESTSAVQTGSVGARRFGDGALSGAALVLASKLVALLISFATIAVVARTLSPGDYGLVAMVTSVTAFLAVFSDMGLSLVTVQRKELTESQSSALFWVNAGFAGLLGLFTIGGAPLLVWFYEESRLLPITCVIALTFPLTGLTVQHQALLKRNMRFRKLAMVRLGGTTTGAGLSVLMALGGFGYWALVWQPVAVAAAEMLASWLAMPWRPGRPRNCEGLRGMLGFGGNLTAHGMVGYIATHLDSLLIGRLCGTHQLGLYATSYSLMMRPIALAGYSVGETAIPELCRHARDSERFRASYRKMFTVTALLGLPASLGGALWADDLVAALLGAQWFAATPILTCLFIAAAPRLLLASTGWVYVATGRPRRMLYWQLMYTPFVALAFLFGIEHGALGVAAAYACANGLALVPGFIYCMKGTGLQWDDVAGPIMTPLLCTLTAALGATIAQNMLWPALDPGPARLLVRLGLAAVLYMPLTMLSVSLIRDGVRKLISSAARSSAPGGALSPAVSTSSGKG